MAKQAEEEPVPLHAQFPPVTFVPRGAPDNQQDQGNLLAAKQSPGFPMSGGVFAHCLSRRGERLMLDFTAQGVGVRFEIDGVWLNADPMDRQTGNAVLAVYKTITNLNVQDRRSKQEGTFGAEFSGGKFNCEFVSQGVKTGERVLIKINPKKPKFGKIEELGMRDKMRGLFKELMDTSPGMVLISAPKGGGLSATWDMSLTLADRLIRDFVCLEDKNAPDNEVINVNQHYYDKAASETPLTILPRLALKEPDVWVVPDPTSAEVLAELCKQVNEIERMAVTRVHASNAIEALLRLVSYKSPLPELAKALTGVLNVRLARRLCDQCKQPFQPPPQLLQRLGIPAGRVQVLYQEYKPPAEPPVDEKGRPIEIPICQKCGGLGYCGRIGLFELLTLDDKIREALVKQPNLETLKRVAKASGHRSLQEEGILQVALGVTSVQELQRALKQ
ncbi:MAG: general secretion pathway protein GspE [Planctomycetaceae bacterium]|nr:general secretion pathway protein GspE [Planctomycetaceae bacterium]